MVLQVGTLASETILEIRNEVGKIGDELLVVLSMLLLTMAARMKDGIEVNGTKPVDERLGTRKRTRAPGHVVVVDVNGIIDVVIGIEEGVVKLAATKEGERHRGRISIGREVVDGSEVE